MKKTWMPGSCIGGATTTTPRSGPAIAGLFTLAALLLSGCGQSQSIDDGKSLAATLGAKLTVAPATAVRRPDTAQPIPDFGAIPEVKAKKEAFFAYMAAKIRAANDDVWAERLFVLSQREQLAAGVAVEADEIEALQELAEYYKVAFPGHLNDAWFAELLIRVDTVPASLVLAQAANESGWGTSRFAREGRNFFGIWCYTEGCGLAPKRRNNGATHQVRKYPTVLRGVRDYIRNINVGNAYADLREARAALRADDQVPSGKALAAGLRRYSERGEEYVKELRAMIKQNQLSRFTVHRTKASNGD